MLAAKRVHQPQGTPEYGADCPKRLPAFVRGLAGLCDLAARAQAGAAPSPSPLYAPRAVLLTQVKAKMRATAGETPEFPLSKSADQQYGVRTGHRARAGAPGVEMDRC